MYIKRRWRITILIILIALAFFISFIIFLNILNTNIDKSVSTVLFSDTSSITQLDKKLVYDAVNVFKKISNQDIKQQNINDLRSIPNVEIIFSKPRLIWLGYWRIVKTDALLISFGSDKLYACFKDKANQPEQKCMSGETTFFLWFINKIEEAGGKF